MENMDMKKSPVKQLRQLRTAGILSIIAVLVTIAGTLAVVIGVVLNGGLTQEASTGGLNLGAAGTAGIGALVLIGGAVVGIIAGIMQLVALIKGTSIHAGFKNALIFVVAGIALQVIVGFIPMAPVAIRLLNVLVGVFSFMVIYFVLTAAVDFLNKKGNKDLADVGVRVRSLYMTCTAVIVVAEFVSLIPGVASAVGIITIVAAITEIVALFKYTSFLGKSADALEK